MIIAIPAVSNYINESRKKALVTTIGMYIDSVGVKVNSLEYNFMKENTIFALPVECLPVEKGGDDPFGEWIQSGKNYWSFVLVQYVPETSSYIYGFTFKDSAGYGLFPTSSNNFDKNGKDIIPSVKDLERPFNSYAVEYLDYDKWNGFDIHDDTELVVLDATSEGEVGDGINSCALMQKGVNYHEVENFKKNEKMAYAVYSADDNSLTFVKTTRNLKLNDKIYGKTITAFFDDFESKTYSSSTVPWGSYRDSIKSVEFKNKVSPVSTKWWFNGFNFCEYIDVTNLDTSNVTDFSYMFYFTGKSVSNFKIVGLSTWNTSKVRTMDNMFRQSGMSASSWDIGNISNWNTSNVTNMRYMFFQTATRANYKLDLTGWNVDNVSNHDSFNSMVESKVLAPNWGR